MEHDHDSNPQTDKVYQQVFAYTSRRAFVADKEGFREQYFDLLKRIEAALWIEAVVREKVLPRDHLSVPTRLRGAQLAEHARFRKVQADNAPAPRNLEPFRPSVLSSAFFDCFYSGWPYVPTDADFSESGTPQWELIPFDWCTPKE